MGVIDQALPTDGCARFLKIDPHDNCQLILHVLSHSIELVSVFEGAFRIVDRTGPDHHQEAWIFPGQNAAHEFASGHHRLIGHLCHGELFLHGTRGEQPDRGFDS